MPPRISVVIVLYNALEAAGKCLASLEGRGLEVIVVDNASTEGGLEALAARFPEVRLIRNRVNVGFARAVNQAVERSGGAYVFLLNPDTWLMNDAPAILADWLEAHPRAAGAGPRLRNPDGSLQTSTYRFPTLFQSAAHLFWLKKLMPVDRLRGRLPGWLGRRFGQMDPHDRARVVDYCTGAALMIRRTAWDRLGGLDERFFLYYEEKDFCLRARGAGGDIWFVPQAEVAHHIGASSDTAPETALMARYRSMLLYFAKHQPHRLTALRWLLKAGAAFRHGLLALGGCGREARAWRQVYRLTKDEF